MLYTIAAGAFALLVSPAPMVQQAPMVQSAVSQSRLAVEAPSNIFPTTLIADGFDDELEEMARQQAAKDAAIDAKKKVLRERQEAADAEAAAKFAEKQRQDAERAEKKAAALAATQEKQAAAKASKASVDASRGRTSESDDAKEAKRKAKYGTVQKIDKQAERVAARIAAGEDAPTLFGGN